MRWPSLRLRQVQGSLQRRGPGRAAPEGPPGGVLPAGGRCRPSPAAAQALQPPQRRRQAQRHSWAGPHADPLVPGPGGAHSRAYSELLNISRRLTSDTAHASLHAPAASREARSGALRGWQRGRAQEPGSRAGAERQGDLVSAHGLLVAYGMAHASRSAPQGGGRDAQAQLADRSCKVPTNPLLLGKSCHHVRLTVAQALCPARPPAVHAQHVPASVMPSGRADSTPARSA